MTRDGLWATRGKQSKVALTQSRRGAEEGQDSTVFLFA